MRKVLCLFMVLLAALSVTAQEPTAPAPAGKDPDAEVSDDEILGILRTLAAGDPHLEETREASFSLAEALIRIRGWEDPETRQVAESLGAAYPEDPKTSALLLRLIDIDLEAGDRYGAHLLYRYLNTADFLAENPEIATRSIENAVQIDDHPAAFNWSRNLDLERLQESRRVPARLAILQAAHGVRRLDLALETARKLEAEAPEELRVHAPALLAAARSFEEMGFLEDASRLYEVFINIHTGSESAPAATLSLARLAVRQGRIKWARHLYGRLTENAAASPEAHAAKLDLLEMEPGSVAPDRIPAYLAIAAAATEPGGARDAFDRLLERFIGAGYPLEAVSAVASVARPDDGTLLPLEARKSLSDALEAAIALLVARKDWIGVAAAANEARTAGLEIPASQVEAVHTARTALGLDPHMPDAFNQALENARSLIAAGKLEEGGAALERALSSEAARNHSRRVEAQTLLAETLWRTRRDAEALVRIKETMRIARTDSEKRALLVLRADILFSVRNTKSACYLYRKAAAISGSAWVDSLVEVCDVLEQQTAGNALIPTEKQG